jgi:hypothetical protein
VGGNACSCLVIPPIHPGRGVGSFLHPSCQVLAQILVKAGRHAFHQLIITRSLCGRGFVKIFCHYGDVCCQESESIASRCVARHCYTRAAREVHRGAEGKRKASCASHPGNQLPGSPIKMKLFILGKYNTRLALSCAAIGRRSLVSRFPLQHTREEQFRIPWPIPLVTRNPKQQGRTGFTWMAGSVVRPSSGH